jgi:hypothetical protein
MSTVAEIESAIEQLPPEQVREVVAWLEARNEKLAAAGNASVSSSLQESSPFFGFCKGIVFREGWDEPLEDFKPYME